MEGIILLWFCLNKELCMSNTWFWRDNKKWMCRVGENENKIEVVLIKESSAAVFSTCEGNPLGISACRSSSTYR